MQELCEKSVLPVISLDNTPITKDASDSVNVNMCKGKQIYNKKADYDGKFEENVINGKDGIDKPSAPKIPDVQVGSVTATSDTLILNPNRQEGPLLQLSEATSDDEKIKLIAKGQYEGMTTRRKTILITGDVQIEISKLNQFIAEPT